MPNPMKQRIAQGQSLCCSKVPNDRSQRIHVNPERSFGGTNGEPPSEASQLRKGGPGVLSRKISKTYIANGAIYVIPELYL